jgi:hypothetical protein
MSSFTISMPLSRDSTISFPSSCSPSIVDNVSISTSCASRALLVSFLKHLEALLFLTGQTTKKTIKKDLIIYTHILYEE